MKPRRPLTDIEAELLDALSRRLAAIVLELVTALHEGDARRAQAPLAALVIAYPAVVLLKDRVKDA